MRLPFTNVMAMESSFEYFVKEDLHRYLAGKGEMDERIPECPDVEGLWMPVAESYGADGIREFNEYPEVSLGWMMFVGMAVTEFWDKDWERYSAIEDLYLHLRDVRGFDCMDEHILEDILCLDKEAAAKTSELVADCAGRVYSLLRHSQLEPGTAEAFRGYISCLHQLYLAGMCVQLHRLGYHMSRG